MATPTRVGAALLFSALLLFATAPIRADAPPLGPGAAFIKKIIVLMLENRYDCQPYPSQLPSNPARSR